jgi:hypothetical protein
MQYAISYCVASVVARFGFAAADAVFASFGVAEFA